MKSKNILLATGIVFLAAMRLHAQDLGGCVDSPENPTLVLGLIVGAAGVGYPRLRRYLQGRGNKGK